MLTRVTLFGGLFIIQHVSMFRCLYVLLYLKCKLCKYNQCSSIYLQNFLYLLLIFLFTCICITFLDIYIKFCLMIFNYLFASVALSLHTSCIHSTHSSVYLFLVYQLAPIHTSLSSFTQLSIDLHVNLSVRISINLIGSLR